MFNAQYSINVLFNSILEFDKKSDIPTWYNGNIEYNESTHRWETEGCYCWGNEK